MKAMETSRELEGSKYCKDVLDIPSVLYNYRV
jgi:hypothetical protein